MQIFAFIISRDEIVGKMRSSGILIGGCGESSIRFRPALIFEPQHADIMIDKFDEVLSKMKWGLGYIFMTFLPMYLYKILHYTYTYYEMVLLEADFSYFLMYIIRVNFDTHIQGIKWFLCL